MNEHYVKAWFQSMGNAIAKERTGYQILVTEAEGTLARYESLRRLFSEQHQERGDYYAANLRGTLKNPAASYNSIKSLKDDLDWIIQAAIRRARGE